MGTTKNRVRLSEEERIKIERYLCSKKNSHEGKVRGKILLALDANTYEKMPSKQKVAKQLKVHEETVSKVSKNYVTHGLEVAIERKKRATPPVLAIVTGGS